jgi:hypothetical protein
MAVIVSVIDKTGKNDTLNMPDSIHELGITSIAPLLPIQTGFPVHPPLLGYM